MFSPAPQMRQDELLLDDGQSGEAGDGSDGAPGEAGDVKQWLDRRRKMEDGNEDGDGGGEQATSRSHLSEQN